MLNRFAGVIACLIVASTLTTSAQEPRRVPEQTQDPERNGYPNFDIRETGTGAASLVAQRTAAISAFAAMPEETASRTRISVGRFGLPKIYQRDGNTLTTRSTGKPEEIARNFLRTRNNIFFLSSAEVDSFRLVVQDPTDRAIFLAFNQTVNGVDVYNAQIKFTMNRQGEVVQVATGDVVPGLQLLTNPALTPEQAVRAAFTVAGVAPAALTRLGESEGKQSFANPAGNGSSPITAQLSVFPMTAGSARLAYRILLEVSGDAYYEILIDAENGGLLFRHNLYRSVGQANVWTESPIKGSRTLVQFPGTSNTTPAGWIPVNGTVTTGNNVDAYLDADGNDAPDAGTIPNLQNGRASAANQSFDFPFGNGTTNADPRLFQAASVTNLFYLVNIAHDFYYDLGFNEVAGNYQTDNFGKGGLGGDAVLAASLNSRYGNNAAFAPTPDGTAPRIRMGVFTLGTTSPTDDLDSSYDGQVVLHEYGHGVSTRLVGARTSVTCLNGIQSGGLGEGWSDYFSISYYDNPVEGAYISQNALRGIRRSSYEGYAFTYEDIGNEGYEPHRDGEIWTGMLWDIRKSLGANITDRLVVDGLKSTPCSPSMIDARDGILAADAANGNVNRTVLWTVFARHGMGYSAAGLDGSTQTGTRYDAAFDMPPDLQPTRAPAVTSNPITPIGLNSAYRYTVAATNPAGGALSYSISGPSGMTIDSSGNVTWNAAFVGGRVKITITDIRGNKVVHGFLLPVNTVLTDNVPVSISGTIGTYGYASITVPPNTEVLEVTLRDGSGDTDLLVFANSTQLSGYSARDGSTESVSFSRPQAGIWLVWIYGYRDYSLVTLKASLTVPNPINIESTLTNLSGGFTSETFYRISVPPGASVLSISTTGTGDADLYLRKDLPPSCPFSATSLCLSDRRSIGADTSAESILVSDPAPGEWYLDIAGYAAYSGVRMEVSQYLPLSITTTSLPPGMIGDSYSQSLTVTGGKGPYVWALVSGSLPPGLTLATNGTVAGTLAASGTYPVTVRASDSLSKETTKALTIKVISPIAPVALTGGGTASVATSGNALDVSSGYAVGSVSSGTAPYATAVFSITQNGNIVSEAGVPASPPLLSSRVFVDYRTGVADGNGTIDVNTGVALVNRNSSPVSVTYTLRGQNGSTLTTGHGTLDAGAHRARFIHELFTLAPDFKLPADFSTSTQFGTLDVTSTQPISVLALRLTTNQRQETLLSTMPIANLSAPPTFMGALYFAQLVDGGGYRTSINLINPSNVPQIGNIAFYDDMGNPLSVVLTNGTSGSTIPYSIPAAGAVTVQTNGSAESVRVGSVRVGASQGTTTPVGALVFSNRRSGTMVTESAVASALPTTRARVYVDTSAGHNTGIAIINASTNSLLSAPPVDVTVQAFQTDGTTRVGTTSTISLSTRGHRSAFATDLISGLPPGFKGVIELSAPSTFVALTLRSLVNGRGDFLLTTFPLADSDQTPVSPVVLPQIANGGGYKTEFIFVGTGSPGLGTSSLTLEFFADDGTALVF